MIPRAADVEVDWAVDYEQLIRLTDEDFEQGGFGTRGYAASIVANASWEGAEELLEQERRVLAKIAKRAADEQEFDRIASEEDLGIFDDPMEGVVSLDFGMLSVCTALGAAGMATAASCRGHPTSSAWSRHPLVLLTADRRRARVLENLARKANCGLGNTENHRLALWAQSIEDMLSLAALLLENRERFDRWPLPAALRRARGISPPPPRTRPRKPRGQTSLF